MSVKTKLAKKAVTTTAKHTAHGTASKFSRKPFRSTTLLAAGVVIGFVLGRLIGGRGGSDFPDPVAQAPAPPNVAVNGASATEKTSTSTSTGATS
jgi:hypothetical protein